MLHIGFCSHSIDQCKCLSLSLAIHASLKSGSAYLLAVSDSVGGARQSCKLHKGLKFKIYFFCEVKYHL